MPHTWFYGILLSPSYKNPSSTCTTPSIQFQHPHTYWISKIFAKDPTLSFLCLIQGYKERSRKWRWWTMAILWEHPREGLQAKDLEEYWDNKELDYISLKDV